MDDTESQIPTCDRCQQPIQEGEPYAILEMSLRFFEDDEEDNEEIISVPAAFGIATVCRDCGEQYQLTSPHVPRETKLCRVALLATGVQHALDALPPLPEFPDLVRQENDSPEGWGRCTFCGEPFQLGMPWIDLSTTYEQYEVNPDDPETTSITTLNYYDSAAMCFDCCLLMPFSMLEADDAHDAAYDWTAAFVRLLGGSMDQPEE